MVASVPHSGWDFKISKVITDIHATQRQMVVWANAVSPWFQ
jgi:hypothetical protein